ncbi:hypothetical protein COY95_01335 [Candidatus Woesearchaeota archaeon CG_4_10_14_0_8_um_filter_47_5]|nr:MAG: hypothetical protein COY95_01335 [Candidatus Woesearchaeota archaeon CG_4_10_14_0_8_um_filter_47_5]
MAKGIIIFGSASDSVVYAPLREELPDFEFRICSAHRSPAFLDRILEKEYGLIVAGAGLAAHLPGVIASKTISPVIGIPCSGNFGGLDALLSIVQMPPGIPVLCVGVDNHQEAARNARLMLQAYEGVYKGVTITGAQGVDPKRIAAAETVFSEYGIPCRVSPEIKEDGLNIVFVNLMKEAPLLSDISDRALCIGVPLCRETRASDSLRLPELMGRGLWVGLNRAENAALACVQIMNHDGSFSAQLRHERQEMAEKIVRANG